MSAREKTLAQRLVVESTGLFIVSVVLVLTLIGDLFEEERLSFGWWVSIGACLLWSWTAYGALKSRRYARGVLAEVRTTN